MEAMDGTNKIFLSFKGQPYCSQQTEKCSHRIVNNICQSASAMVAVVSKGTAGLYAPGPNVAWTPWWINRDLLAGKEFFINPEISRWLERQRHMLHLNMEVLVLLYSQLQTKKTDLIMRICGVKELTETVIDSLSVRLFSHFTPLILKSVLLKAENIKLLLVEGFNVKSHYGTHNRIERTREQARSLLKHLHGEWEFAGGGEICRHKMIDDNYGRTKVLCITCNAIDGSVNSITVSISLSVPTPRTARFLH
jgi:hypothetical protein